MIPSHAFPYTHKLRNTQFNPNHLSRLNLILPLQPLHIRQFSLRLHLYPPPLLILLTHLHSTIIPRKPPIRIGLRRRPLPLRPLLILPHTPNQRTLHPNLRTIPIEHKRDRYDDDLERA